MTVRVPTKPVPTPEMPDGATSWPVTSTTRILVDMVAVGGRAGETRAVDHKQFDLEWPRDQGKMLDHVFKEGGRKIEVHVTVMQLTAKRAGADSPVTLGTLASPIFRWVSAFRPSARWRAGRRPSCGWSTETGTR